MTRSFDYITNSKSMCSIHMVSTFSFHFIFFFLQIHFISGLLPYTRTSCTNVFSSVFKCGDGLCTSSTRTPTKIEINVRSAFIGKIRFFSEIYAFQIKSFVCLFPFSPGEGENCTFCHRTKNSMKALATPPCAYTTHSCNNIFASIHQRRAATKKPRLERTH